MSRVRWPVIAGAALAGLLVFVGLGILDASISEGDQQLATRAIAANRAWRNYVARDRQASEENHQRQIVALQAMVAAVTVANLYRDSADRADTLPPPDTSNQVALHWHVMYMWERVRADSLDGALMQSQAVSLLARADASRAWHLVAEGIKVSFLNDEALQAQRCRVLFVPCPSRTVVAIAAFTAGAIAVAASKR